MPSSPRTASRKPARGQVDARLLLPIHMTAQRFHELARENDSRSDALDRVPMYPDDPSIRVGIKQRLQPRRMKTQDSPPSDADSIMWDRAQDKRAGRITGTIDDNAFSGLPQHGEKLQIITNYASSTGFDPHVA